MCIIKRGCELDCVRQLDRAQNGNHEDDAWIEQTLCETFVGPIDEFHSLHKQHPNRKPTAAVVFSTYDGVKHINRSSVYHTAITAIRLQADVVHENGKIMNEEQADLAYSQLQDGHSQRAYHTQVSIFDKSRVFQNFLNLTSSKKATGCLNTEGKDAVSKQINVLHRLK